MLYFNYAGLSPARPEVVHAMHRALEMFNSRLFSESGIAWYRKQVQDCSTQVAALLDIRLDPTHYSVLLCPNATISLKIALSMTDLRAGDKVITSDQEHPSMLHTLSILQQKGVALTVIPSPTEGQFLARLDDACRDRRTKLIALSHVAHSDGRIFPLSQVCDIAAKRDVLVAVDGAQAVGHIPVNVGRLGVDFYYFSGHKWCAGPMGTGALVITQQYKEKQAGQADPAESALQEDYLDVGTQNIGLIAGLGLACELKRTEWPTLCRLADLRTLFGRCLRDLHDVHIAAWDGAHAPGILSFYAATNAGFDPAAVADYLSKQYDIVLKPVRYPGCSPMLRASWSPATADHDILLLAERLEEALEKVVETSP